MSDEPTIDTASVGRWTLNITNHISPFEPSIYPLFARVPDLTFEATFEVDRAEYDRLVAAAPTYTVEHTTDHNPWHRTATGPRARLRKLRDGIWWTFQRRVLRRALIESTKITIPNCELKAEGDV